MLLETCFNWFSAKLIWQENTSFLHDIDTIVYNNKTSISKRKMKYVYTLYCGSHWRRALQMASIQRTSFRPSILSIAHIITMFECATIKFASMTMARSRGETTFSSLLLRVLCSGSGSFLESALITQLRNAPSRRHHSPCPSPGPIPQ